MRYEGPDGLIAYLGSKPDDFVIDWYADGMDSEKDWDTSWVDVMFEDRLAWVISSGLFENEEDDLCWPPDRVAHILVDPARPDPYAGCITTALNAPARDEEIREIRSVRALVSDESYWVGAPAWSATEINRAIEDWCLRNVGRLIRARWDAEHGPSPQAAEINDLLEAMRSGIEPSYLIRPGEQEGATGPSVYASEQVMEVLMQSMMEPDE